MWTQFVFVFEEIPVYEDNPCFQTSASTECKYSEFPPKALPDHKILNYKTPLFFVKFSVLHFDNTQKSLKSRLWVLRTYVKRAAYSVNGKRGAHRSNEGNCNRPVSFD